MKKLFSRFMGSRRPFRLTKGGWIFVLYTTGIGAGAINTGNNLLYLIFGLFLGLLMASGVLSDLSLWGVEAHPDFPPSFEAGQPGLASLRLINKKRWMPSLSLTVEMEGELRGESLLFKKYIPVLGRGQALQTHMVFLSGRRGLFRMTALRLSTRFPFGLLYKWWPHQSALRLPDVFVYPGRVDASGAADLARALGEEDAPVQDRRGDGTTTVGIREFRDGDNPKRIHWRASAKRGEDYLLREMERDERREARYRWPDLRTFHEKSHEKVEEFIRFTASLLRLSSDRKEAVCFFIPGALQDGGEVLFRVRQGPVGEEWRPALEFLSLFDKDDPGSPEETAYLEVEREASQGMSAGEIDLYALFRQWRRSVFGNLNL